ncbi:eukaryotic translation initiation factor 3 subunit A-like [Athene cunicularia]|uniref:eukaryotic translation initiation factor 3 subunit A-like n=1 Tax=Athene cunicularia TaxID=194338 RepID=UPI000EF68C17|nr:eukaryotic translation initiation factor 3 subunit A-like [Athene cunicularia]
MPPTAPSSGWRFSRLGGQKGRAEPSRPWAAGGSRRGWSWRGRRKGRTENIEGTWAAAAWPCRRRAPASPGGGQPGEWSFRRRGGAGGRKEKEAFGLSHSPGSAESESCGLIS